MKKRLTITNLIAMPLIASAVFLASPVMASGPLRAGQTEVRNITSQESMSPGTKTRKRGVAGTVTSISGTIIVVTRKDNVQYTVDASRATIMKAGAEADVNPTLVSIGDIKVGDAIMVRGTIKDFDINANKIFDGKPFKNSKLHKRKRNSH